MILKEQSPLNSKKENEKQNENENEKQNENENENEKKSSIVKPKAKSSKVLFSNMLSSLAPIPKDPKKRSSVVMSKLKEIAKEETSGEQKFFSPKIL